MKDLYSIPHTTLVNIPDEGMHIIILHLYDYILTILYYIIIHKIYQKNMITLIT